MPRAAVKGGYIHYHVLGEGVPLVMLRGMSRSIRHWLGYDEFLAKYFKVITLDNRGIGRSDCEVPWSVSVHDMAEDVFAVLDQLNIESAHVMGISLGGMIALAMGLDQPERCRSLTVINSSIAGQLTPRLSIPAIAKMVRNARRLTKIDDILAELLVSPHYTNERRAELKAEWLKIMEVEGFPHLTSVKQALAALRFQVTEKLAQLTVPTLVMYGTGDQFVPVVNSLMIHRMIPKARLVKLEGAGHDAMIECPQELADEMRQFISEVERSSNICPEPGSDFPSEGLRANLTN